MSRITVGYVALCFLLGLCQNAFSMEEKKCRKKIAPGKVCSTGGSGHKKKFPQKIRSAGAIVRVTFTEGKKIFRGKGTLGSMNDNLLHSYLQNAYSELAEVQSSTNNPKFLKKQSLHYYLGNWKKFTSDPNVEEKNQKTILHNAIEWDDLELLTKISRIDRIQPNKKDQGGKTALDRLLDKIAAMDAGDMVFKNELRVRSNMLKVFKNNLMEESEMLAAMKNYNSNYNVTKAWKDANRY